MIHKLGNTEQEQVQNLSDAIVHLVRDNKGITESDLYILTDHIRELRLHALLLKMWESGDIQFIITEGEVTIRLPEDPRDSSAN